MYPSGHFWVSSGSSISSGSGSDISSRSGSVGSSPEVSDPGDSPVSPGPTVPVSDVGSDSPVATSSSPASSGSAEGS